MERISVSVSNSLCAICMGQGTAGDFADSPEEGQVV